MLNRTALMQSPFGFQVGRMRNLWCRMESKTVTFPGDLNLSKPFVFDFANSKESGLIVNLCPSSVFTVQSVGHISKIFNPVVNLVSVNVVNKIKWPLSINVKPNNSMNLIAVCSNKNRQIPFCCGRADNISNLYVVAIAYFSNKLSSISVVVKKFAYALRGKIGVSHDSVLSMIGQRPAIADNNSGFRYFNGGM